MSEQVRGEFAELTTRDGTLILRVQPTESGCVWSIKNAKNPENDQQGVANSLKEAKEHLEQEFEDVFLGWAQWSPIDGGASLLKK
jgi:hypothetical protein